MSSLLPVDHIKSDSQNSKPVIASSKFRMRFRHPVDPVDVQLLDVGGHHQACRTGLLARLLALSFSRRACLLVVYEMIL
ncbi:hypothetical protein V2G26_014068 [Clonostachys chloroleuca]